MRLACIAIALTLMATPAFAAGKLPVEMATIQAKTKTYDIKVQYPQTGNKAVDTAIADWAKKEVASFRTQAADNDMSVGAYSLYIEPDIKRNDDAIFAVVFTEDMYAGGAHGDITLQAMDFLMPDGWRVYLPEIFTDKGLARISALAIADLDKQLGDSTDSTDQIKGGAGPDWSNFANFSLLPDKLDIQFAPYAVASYAAGPQETKIALSALRGFYRKDWRAPVASFDCTTAKTNLEKTICSDVTLARLDRQTAGVYRTKLGIASEGAEKDAVRNAQRAWLAKRNTACVGGGAATCISRLYKERLAALEAQP
ncbi:MAG TPA: DUF3298 domain-containing protein [Rhizomicrobium sp.]